MPGWTPVPKPTESSITSQTGGSPIGLLMALTYAETQSSTLTGWSAITKPNSYDWTVVAKPTT